MRSTPCSTLGLRFLLEVLFELEAVVVALEEGSGVVEGGEGSSVRVGRGVEEGAEDD